MEMMKSAPKKDSYLVFILTMDFALDILEKGIIDADEYRRFLEVISTKYGHDNLRILYQTKLDIYLDKSVNTSAKGVYKYEDY